MQIYFLVQDLNTTKMDRDGYLNPTPQLLEENDYSTITTKLPDYETYKTSPLDRNAKKENSILPKLSLEVKATSNLTKNQLESLNCGKLSNY